MPVGRIVCKSLHVFRHNLVLVGPEVGIALRPRPSQLPTTIAFDQPFCVLSCGI